MIKPRTQRFEQLYPFRSNYLDIGGLKYHYLDEGQGHPLVMVHGNPTWSFYFRKLVLAFRKKYRIIVPDHMGCGFSDKPQQYDYHLKTHIDNLEILMKQLGLKDICLFLHDWGGPIGMGYAVRNPERIKRFVIFNSAAFLSNIAPWRILTCRLPFLGPAMVRGLNIFARAAVYMACHRRERMTKSVRAAYLMPYNNYANRIAILRFVQDIPLSPKDRSYSIIQNMEKSLSRFKKHPVLIIWGEKDFCFTLEFLKRWKEYFPEAEVRRIREAGHYVVEDAHELMIPWISDFLEKT